MLQKSDLILLLTEMQDDGIDVSSHLMSVARSTDIPMETVRYINNHRQLDVASFYERMRKNHNEKRSNLYKNIVKEDTDINDVIVTLSAFALQVGLFARNIDNPDMFLKHVRIEEVTRVLNNYYKTYDIANAMRLLVLIKADLKAFESIR